MSVGDLKYTTFSFNDFKIRNMDNITAIKTKRTRANLNLTFLPYMVF